MKEDFQKALKKVKPRKNSMIIDILPDLQSWSKYFGTLQCFSRDLINYK